MIDIASQHLKLIKKILLEYVPNCEVRAFGSRVTKTAKPYSDLDLVIVGQDKIDRNMLNRLQEAFEYSSLPFRVDILDWHRISKSFRNIITKDYVIIFPN